MGESGKACSPEWEMLGLSLEAWGAVVGSRLGCGSVVVLEWGRRVPSGEQLSPPLCRCASWAAW